MPFKTSRGTRAGISEQQPLWRRLGRAESFRLTGVNPNVFFLGLVSFFTDVSSEMIMTVLPLFLSSVLGVGTTVIGAIEGVADSTATLMRAPSGWLSDRWRRRKGLTVLGYGLSTAAKPFLFLATGWGLVLGLRFADRVGKGVRTAPRDALIADSVEPGFRGRAFGFHRALDTAGAVAGILGAALVVFLLQRGDLKLEHHTFSTIVLVATVPAVLALLVLWRFVKEPKPQRGNAGLPHEQAGLNKPFPLRFKLLLGVLLLFTLGNSSDAFLVLRASNLGLSVAHILLLMAGFNVVYSVLSTPAGVLSDRVGRRNVILGGWAIYALVYLGLGFAGAAWHVVVLVLTYGVYYAAAEGAGRALVADLVPGERRGTAYGLYNTAAGVMAFPASLAAGWLWQAFGPRAPFFFGGALAGVSALLLALALRPGQPASARRAAGSFTP